MSTHLTRCIVCNADVLCSSDEHALGCGGPHGDGGCENPPFIEFCSLACALELQRRLTASIQHYRDLIEPDGRYDP